ncbi:hypothetical protein C8R45DRAFT_196613 [Mycena sanguinolenta]|nr:hypothetical protein C8R45DRAFT_196613 [Mycena sanguinolenta]
MLIDDTLATADDLCDPRRAADVAWRGRRRRHAREHLRPRRGDNGDVSTTAHAVSSTSRATSSAFHVPASTFSHTHAHHGSNSTTHSASTSDSSKSGALSEVETEDSVAPVTPLPNARFDLGPPQHASKGMGMGKSGERTVGQAYAELVEEGDGEEDFVDASGEVDDIEDDWVDPVPPPPPPVPKKSSSSSKEKDKDKEKDRSSKSKAKGKSKKATPVPVPSMHYPFPVSAEDGAGRTGRTSPRERERERNVMVSPRAAGVNVAAGAGEQRMHTARADAERGRGWNPHRGLRPRSYLPRLSSYSLLLSPLPSRPLLNSATSFMLHSMYITVPLLCISHVHIVSSFLHYHIPWH